MLWTTRTSSSVCSSLTIDINSDKFTTVKCNSTESIISIRRTSCAKAGSFSTSSNSWRLISDSVAAISSASSSKLSRWRLYDWRFFMNCSEREVIDSIVVTMIRSSSECRRMISVGNLMHISSWRGKGRLVMPFRIELFPEDWSPHTTSWGRSTWSSMPLALNLAICFKRKVDLADCNPDRSSDPLMITLVPQLFLDRFYLRENIILYIWAINRLIWSYDVSLSGTQDIRTEQLHRTESESYRDIRLPSCMSVQNYFILAYR